MGIRTAFPNPFSSVEWRIGRSWSCGNQSPTMPNKTQHNLCQKPLQIELNQAESMCEWARTKNNTSSTSKDNGQGSKDKQKQEMDVVCSSLFPLSFFWNSMRRFLHFVLCRSPAGKRILCVCVESGGCMWAACKCPEQVLSALLFLCSAQQMQICLKFIECTWRQTKVQSFPPGLAVFIVFALFPKTLNCKFLGQLKHTLKMHFLYVCKQL